MNVPIIRFGPPADPRHAEIFVAGCIKAPARVPVTRAFDATAPIGWALIDEHGAAALELEAGVDASRIRHVGLGFRVIASEFADGIRTIQHLEPITLGVEFARELPVVGGVGEQWAEYLEACELTAAPPAQLEELRRAFYAGAQGMYYAVLGAATLDDDDASEARLEAMARELSDYLRLFKARAGIS